MNSQYGAPPSANDAIFDYLEGALVELLRRLVQSEAVVLRGDINLLQVVRLSTAVLRTGFIRDFGVDGEHSRRTTALSNMVVVLLAGISLVRYFHLVLGAVVMTHKADSTLSNTQKQVWALLATVWQEAGRTLVRAMTDVRNDVSLFILDA